MSAGVGTETRTDGRGVVLLSLVQVQERCGVSRSTVWRMINEHGLKVVRWAGMIRVKESDLAAWVEKHTQQVSGETRAASVADVEPSPK